MNQISGYNVNADQETGNIPFKIIKSSTQKNGSSIRLSRTMGQCLVCTTAIDKVSQVIINQTQLPLVMANLITEYFEDNHQYVGYVLLHKKSRRCVHVLCIKCYETIFNTCLIDYTLRIQCPHPKCDKIICITDIGPSLLN